MGATHIAALNNIPGLELGGVCTTNERALTGDLTEVGGNLDLPPARYDFSSVHKCKEWRELIADRELGAIDICLPTDLHAEVALAALAAGKHVICEKPMALNTAQCRQMIEAADQAGHVLMIGQVLRFWPEYVALREAVKQRQYGAVQAVLFRRSAGLPDWSRWLPREERSGGAVLDMLVHDIDQAISLFGLPETVSARGMGPVDTIDATLSYASGVKVEIKGGWLPAGEPFSMGFHLKAEHGELQLDASGLFVQKDDGRHPIQPEAGSGYQRELAYFAECCRSGSKPQECPPEESAQGIALALLLKESRKREGQTLRCSD
jgi:predicted dehydrogenase